jgi:pimeloyl-ACP methyl ester carboxylesterase
VWDAEAKKLAPNYRLHLLQINGFAGQPAGANATGPILPGVVEELHQYIQSNKMQPVVIGHSLGGLLTLMLADKYPGDVRKMVIVDTLPFYAMLFNPAATVDGVKPQADAIKQQLLSLTPEQYAAMQPMMAAQLVKNTDAQKIVAASSTSTDRAVMVEAMVEDLQTDLRGDLATVKTPALVLYEHDATLQQPDASAYEQTMQAGYKTMPNAKLVRVDGSRHFIMYDQPEKFDEAVEAFLK